MNLFYSIITALFLILSIFTFTTDFWTGVFFSCVTLCFGILTTYKSFSTLSKPEFRINKKNLRLLIETIANKNHPFNWASSKICLASYARMLRGNADEFQFEALGKFLGISSTQAYNLYIGIDLKNNVLLCLSNGELEEDSWEYSREVAVKYLTSLLFETS